MKRIFVLMRFYDGGGLADYEVVKCKEEDLFDYCAEFEKECIRRNLGTRIGILERIEVGNIIKDIKELKK